MTSKQTSLTGKYLPAYSAVKAITRKILEEVPEARDNSNRLETEVLAYCIVEKIRIPQRSTIRRAGRTIQNKEGLFPPSDNVKKAREEKYRAYTHLGEQGLL